MSDDSPRDPSRRRRLLRLAVRSAALAATVIVLLPVLPWPSLAAIPAAASPYVMLASAIALRGLTATTVVGLPVLVIVLVRRRWFCRWLCPMGLLTEQAGRWRRSGRSACMRLPPLGQWIALVTLAGACLGYPLLLWLDPLALLGGFFSVGLGPRAPGALGWLAIAGLPVVLVLSALWPNIWCLRICPLGGTQDLLAVPQRLWRRKLPSPVSGRGAGGEGGRWSLPRRTVLASAAGLAWAWLARKATGADRPRPLRPPGSVDPELFAGLCIRCGNCLRACPVKIIEPCTGEHGVASLLSPRLSYRENYCLDDCWRCTEVCPSGAIKRLDADEKPNASIGLPRVDMQICLLGDDRECTVCKNYCPYDAIKYVFSEKEYTAKPQIDSACCNGCGACQVNCPTTPAKAIVVYPA